MRSIAQAMLWEYFTRTRWSSLPFIALAIVLWMVPLSLDNRVAVDPNNQEFILIHFLCSMISILLVCTGVTLFSGHPSQSYAFPISTTTLVAWKLFLPSVLAGIIVAIGYSGANLFYKVDLPFSGMALFAICATASLQLFNLQSSSQYLANIVLATVWIVVEVYWVKSRYGDFFSNSAHLWNKVTYFELATVLAALTVTYALGFRTVAFARCGQGMNEHVIQHWLERFREVFAKRPLALSLPFASPEHAQHWYERRQKGAAFPAIATLAVCMSIIPWLLMLFVYWLLGNPVPPNQLSRMEVIQEINDGLIAFGGLLSIFGIFAGMFFGSSDLTGTKSQHNPTISEMLNESRSIQMGTFQATLPLTSIGYWNAIYRTIIQSILVTWCVWAALFLCFLAMASANLCIPEQTFLMKMGAWYLPLTMLGPWMIAANLASLSLTGRSRLVLPVIVTPIVLFTVYLMVMLAIDSNILQQRVNDACVYLISLAIVFGTAWAFFSAIQQRVLAPYHVISAAAISLSIAVYAIVFTPSELPPIAYLMIVAFSALIILPMATAPLAITWNRHR